MAYKDKSEEIADTCSNAESALTSPTLSRNELKYTRVSSQSIFEAESACVDASC